MTARKMVTAEKRAVTLWHQLIVACANEECGDTYHLPEDAPQGAVTACPYCDARQMLHYDVEGAFAELEPVDDSPLDPRESAAWFVGEGR